MDNIVKATEGDQKEIILLDNDKYKQICFTFSRDYRNKFNQYTKNVEENFQKDNKYLEENKVNYFIGHKECLFDDLLLDNLKNIHRVINTDCNSKDDYKLYHIIETSIEKDKSKVSFVNGLNCKKVREVGHTTTQNKPCENFETSLSEIEKIQEEQRLKKIDKDRKIKLSNIITNKNTKEKKANIDNLKAKLEKWKEFVKNAKLEEEEERKKMEEEKRNKEFEGVFNKMINRLDNSKFYKNKKNKNKLFNNKINYLKNKNIEKKITKDDGTKTKINNLIAKLEKEQMIMDKDGDDQYKKMMENFYNKHTKETNKFYKNGRIFYSKINKLFSNNFLNNGYEKEEKNISNNKKHLGNNENVKKNKHFI